MGSSDYKTAFEAGVARAADLIEAHSCVATCCDVQPPAGDAKKLADCVRSARFTIDVARKPAPSGGLTGEQLAQACSNIGWDLRCGRCAAQFYTGTAPYEHDPACKTHGGPPESPQDADDVLARGGPAVSDVEQAIERLRDLWATDMADRWKVGDATAWSNRCNDPGGACAASKWTPIVTAGVEPILRARVPFQAALVAEMYNALPALLDLAQQAVDRVNSGHAFNCTVNYAPDKGCNCGLDDTRAALARLLGAP